MRDHAAEAITLVRGRKRADLETDRVLALALVRLLEIVGEAANRVPAEERSRCRDVPWIAIIGLRNRLIHGYDEVDLDILWEILDVDLPALVAELDRNLADPDR
jgi:uncharacterized protein with HEPN domain